MRFAVAAVAAFLFNLAALATASSVPLFLGDHNTSSSSVRGARHFVEMGGNVYFAADGVNGAELYRADGATSKVQLVKDIWPGKDSADPRNLIAWRNYVFFHATDQDHGTELWRTDGTAEGTIRLTDLAVEPGNPPPDDTPIDDKMSASPHAIFFVAKIEGKSRIFKSDGTINGTTDFGYELYDGLLTPALGYTSFRAVKDGGGFGMWRSDGTAAGTTKVEMQSTTGELLGIRSLVEFNGALYLNTATNTTSTLYKATGFDQDAVLLASVRPDFAAGLARAGGSVYFSALSEIHNQSYEIWKTDGTAPGTTIVKAMPPYDYPDLFRPTMLSSAGDRVLFRVGEYFASLYPYRGNLWTTDGSEAGTFPLTNEIDFGIETVVSTGNRAYFDRWTPQTGRELWTTDGTVDGTTLALDLVPGPDDSTPEHLATIGSDLLFSTRYGFSSDSPLRITEPGQLEILHSTGAESDFEIADKTVINGRVYYSGWDGVHGWEPWVSDGTPEGTHILFDVVPGPSGSTPTLFTAAGDSIFFLAAGSPNYYDLWKTDGSGSGTALVKVLGAQLPARMVSVGSEVYINAVFEGNPRYSTLPFSSAQLWRSDGTAAGTYAVDRLVKNSFLASTGSKAVYNRFDWFHAADPVTSTVAQIDVSLMTINHPTGQYVTHQTSGNVLYVAGAGNGYHVLWKTEGTTSSTSAVKTNPGGAPSYTVMLPSVYDHLFFTEDGGGTTYLWMSDGTRPGNLRLASYPQALLDPRLGPVAALGHQYIYTGYDLTHGYEPWITDGSASGTRLLKDINPGSADPGSYPFEFTSAGGFVYFSANDGIHGRELWRTDGTPEGTLLVKDINPGAANSNPGSIAGLGHQLAFSAEDPVHGRELWTLAEGDPEPTVHDLAPGAAHSAPTDLVVLPNCILYQASSPSTGSDLWALEVTPRAAVNDWGLY